MTAVSNVIREEIYLTICVSQHKEGVGTNRVGKLSPAMGRGIDPGTESGIE